VEHPHCLWLVALRAAEETIELLARLLLVGVGPSAGKTLYPRLRGYDGSQIGELPGL
jgi:hypothetical protein